MIEELHNIKSKKIDLNKGKVVLFFPQYGAKKEDHWMPFPYLYLAPFLEKAGYKVVILDARVEPDWRNVLTKELRDAFALGVTSFTGPDLHDALEASQIARDMQNPIYVVHGGHHATACPDEFLNENVADYVFMGPSEYTLPRVLDSLYFKNEIPSDIKGVLYKRNGKIIGIRKENEAVFNYEESPAYHLIDVEKYRSKNNIVSYFKQRGCPFKCTFCTTGNYSTSDKKRHQYHSEIKHLLGDGPNDLKFSSMFFEDPTFFLKARVVMDVAQLMESIGGGKTKKWRGQARGTFHRQYTSEQFRYMKKSGLASVMFGVESGSQRMLDFMDKRVKRIDYIKSAEVLNDLNIEMYASFMFAMPGETVDDLKQTIKLMHELKAINPNTLLQNCIFTPLPATKMFRDAVALGYKPPKTLKEWAERGYSSRFEERDDINWLGSTYKEYVKVYNEEFGTYKMAYEKEQEGTYVNPVAVTA